MPRGHADDPEYIEELFSTEGDAIVTEYHIREPNLSDEPEERAHTVGSHIVALDSVKEYVES